MKIRKRGAIVLGMILTILGYTIYPHTSYASDQGKGKGHGKGHGHDDSGDQRGPGPGGPGPGGPGPGGSGPGGPGPGGPGPGGPAGEAPVAADDEGTTPENTNVTINVVANDTDADNDINTSTVDLNPGVVGIQQEVTTPNGDYAVDADGVVTFRPETDFSGTTTLAYTVNDSTGLTSNPANIRIEVTVVNEAPVAVNDNGSVVNDKTTEINVLANDSDSDGTLDTSKVDLNTTQSGIQKNADTPQGKWSMNKGKVKYDPAADFVGTATIQYVVYDNDNAPSNPATITITVTSSNAAPVAVNDTGGTTLNKAVNVNVVANDTDSDGTIDPSKVDLNTNTDGIQKTANTSQGSWSVNPEGLVTYTPIALFLGTTTLNYTVMDNKGTISNVATITITVQAINFAPVAVNDNVTTSKNKAVTIKVTQNDTDIDGTVDPTKVDLDPTLAGIQKSAETEQGSYSVNAQGVVTYTPANNFTGVAATTYTVADNAGATSNTASINITVQNVNSAPVAVDDTGATSENITVMVNVVANDIDSDGVIDAAKVDLNTALAGVQASRNTPEGEYSVNNIGIVTYKPEKDFMGTATLNYTVSDNNGAVSNAAKITIAVQPLNAPLANPDVAATKMNQTVDINIVANDKDTDGSIDAATVDLNPDTNGQQKEATTSGGNYSVNDKGVVTFTPKKDFTGTTTILYTVKDDKGVMSNEAMISISVDEVPNIAPEIIVFEEETDTLRFTPGNPVQVTELFEAEDADDDSLSVAEIGFVAETYAQGSDRLIYTSASAHIRGSFDAATGLLTLTGPAETGEFNEAVRSVKYEYAGTDEFHENVKRIYFRVGDGIDFSRLKQRAIKIQSGVTDLDIPTAFTPNADGANDTWRILAPTDISGADFADAEIRVYDKRGTVVYGASGFNSTWDGTYQGKLLPVDTYYYTIELKQRQKRYKGIVAILR